MLLLFSFSINNKASSLLYISILEEFSLWGSFTKSHGFSFISLNLYASFRTELIKRYLIFELLKVQLLKVVFIKVWIKTGFISISFVSLKKGSI